MLYLPPINPHILQNLRSRQLFTITINEIDEAEVLCHLGYSGPHPCHVTDTVIINVTQCLPVLVSQTRWQISPYRW